MKKLISVLLTLALVLTIPVSATAQAAEEPVTLYAATDAELNDPANFDNPAEQTHQAMLDSVYGGIGLKSVGGNTAALTFTFDVETAGRYGFVLYYTAGSGSYKRKCDIIVNDTAFTNVNLATKDWNTLLEYTTNITLEAGENVITIATSTDYDNSTVKTPNIYGIKYWLKEAAAVVTPDVTPKPETPVVTPKPEAPVVTPKPETPVVTPKPEAPVVTPKPEAPATTTWTANTVEDIKPAVEGVYTVAYGDTLSVISKALLGKAADWKLIFDANKDIIANPDVIFPGQKLVIPTK